VVILSKYGAKDVFLQKIIIWAVNCWTNLVWPKNSKSLNILLDFLKNNLPLNQNNIWLIWKISHILTKAL
jgi:hypothetical protein